MFKKWGMLWSKNYAFENCFSRLAGFCQAKVDAHMWNTRFSNAFFLLPRKLVILETCVLCFACGGVCVVRATLASTSTGSIQG